ncbi:hypothetical protein PG984_001507 [Apiospora sp. TS-2023a]
MPGGKMKSEVRLDGLLGSQSKATGNGSRASSAISEEDAIAGYDASQNTAWHPSSPRSASSRSNANRANNQCPTKQLLRDDDFSDDGGASYTPKKSTNVLGRGYEQDQASLNASESDVRDGLVGSEELEFSEPSEDHDGSKSEESVKSFGDEEYTPSQRSTGPRSQSFQKAQRLSTRGAKQKPARTGNFRSPKNRDDSVEGEDADESDTVHATSVGKVEAARGKSQKDVSQKTAKTTSFKRSVDDLPTKQAQQHEEQGTRALPFKRRVAKKPFTPNEESATKASRSKAHGKDLASTDSNTSTKGNGIADVRTHTSSQKEVGAATSNNLFDIEVSSEPDVRPNPSAKRPRKTSDSKASSQDSRNFSQRRRAAPGPRAAKSRNGKSTVEGTQKKPFDDIIDDDVPPLSRSKSATKPNSKKRRSSPQSYGSRAKNSQGPDGGDTIVESNSKDRTDSKQYSPDPNEVPIEITSDVPSSNVDEQDLQPDGPNSTESPARQPKRQLSIHDSSTLNWSIHSPSKKQKTAGDPSYPVGLSSLEQVNASSNSDNDNLMGIADNDATGHDLQSSSVGTKVPRAGDTEEAVVSRQKQSQILNSSDATPMKKRTTMLSVPVSKNIASNDPFTGPRDPMKDKGSTNQHPSSQAPSQHISHGSQPPEAATAPMNQPRPFTGTNAGVNRWDSLGTRPETSRLKPMPPTYYQPRTAQETRQYYEKPWEKRPQPQHDGFSVQHTHPRYTQPSPQQDFAAQLNPKTLEYNQKLAAMPSLRRGNTHRQPFVNSPPGQGSSSDLNITSVGPQLGQRTRQGVCVHGSNVDHLQAMPSAENHMSRSDDLIYGASQGVAAMLHDIVTVIHRRLSPKQAIINNIIREYDRGGSRITATLLKRQQDEFKPAVSKFKEGFHTMSKTFARASQGINEGAKNSTRNSEALSNKLKERRQHMRKLREAIRHDLIE